MSHLCPICDQDCEKNVATIRGLSGRVIKQGDTEEGYRKSIASLEHKIKMQKKHLAKISSGKSSSKVNLSNVSNENKFLRDRVIQKYGPQALCDLLAHIDCPGGFDIENFKKAHKL